jgi:hypothetical protein
MPKTDRWLPWRRGGRTIGYIRGGTYYITRTIGTKRVRLSTGCVTQSAAMAEYERFELNPGAFVSRLGSRAIPRGLDPVRQEQMRTNHLRRRYTITAEEYDRLLMEQGGACPICGAKPQDARRGALEVDHCHATGEVRGLLCGPCNRGIGQLGDSSALLRKAADYLDRHNRSTFKGDGLQVAGNHGRF